MCIEPHVIAVHRVTGGVLGGCGIPWLRPGAPHLETGAALPDRQLPVADTERFIEEWFGTNDGDGSLGDDANRRRN